VTVTLDPVLVQANAGADMDVCDNSAMLSAELPAGATGLWTNEQGGVLIEMPGNPVSFVDNLRPGDNIFIWTLSRPNCPNYSSDQVVVRMALAPVANNDLATVAAGQTRVEINLTANDLINTSGQWSVSIRANPNLGTLQTGQGGRVTYTPKPGIFGVDEFSYELCNLTCPDLCDSAFVRVNIQVDPNRPGPQLPNAITPNGDGLNDELVFDLIENAFDFWPDNELIIFNRWGDIVYQAKPYTNNWRGTNLNGQELPDGTYYYILRLDIANGVIYKGDVTILKR
jgi:gliding motility-associated-like protein